MKKILAIAMVIFATLIIIDVASAAEPVVTDANGATVEVGSR